MSRPLEPPSPRGRQKSFSKRSVFSFPTAAIAGLLVFWCLPTSVHGAYLDSQKRCWLIEVQQEIYRSHFTVADSIGRLLISEYPDDPAGYFWIGVTLLSHMCEREEDFAPEQFERAMDSVETIARRVLDTCSASTGAWMYLFRGHAGSYRSLREVRFGSLLSALRTAFSAKDHYETGLRLDSSCYDLYLGMGLYHYWKSVKAGILRQVGIFSDDIERGLNELHLATDSSAISRESARTGLIWIWLDRGQFDSTIQACEIMRTKYPEGTVFLWPLAQAYFGAGSFNKALEVYDRIRLTLLAPPGNYHNLIECDYNRARAYDELEMTDELKQVARQAREYFDEIPTATAHKQRDRLSYLKRAARL